MFFKDLTLAPADPLFGIKNEFDRDSRKEKVFLTLGIYQTEKSEKKILSAVQKAAVKVVRQDLAAEYLPIDGFAPYIKEVGKLVFGKLFEKKEHLIFGAQTVGGTSALRIGAEFLFDHFAKDIYLSSPTWANHKQIFSRCFFKLHDYPYYNLVENVLEFSEMRQFLENIPERSVILLQPCCHNPTGANLTQEQWRQLAFLFKAKKHLAFFDFAYLGFGSGLEEDAFAVRLFLEMELEFLVAFSASKNFGLYKQRTGALFVVSTAQESKKKIASQIKPIIRTNYSNPPAFGAQIVYEILSDPKLREEWEKELFQMRQRIVLYRQKLALALNGKARYLKQQQGLFSLLGLNQKQIVFLKQKYGIYLPNSSRINIAGVDHHNLTYVSKVLDGELEK